MDIKSGNSVITGAKLYIIYCTLKYTLAHRKPTLKTLTLNEFKHLQKVPQFALTVMPPMLDLLFYVARIY